MGKTKNDEENDVIVIDSPPVLHGISMVILKLHSELKEKVELKHFCLFVCGPDIQGMVSILRYLKKFLDEEDNLLEKDWIKIILNLYPKGFLDEKKIPLDNKSKLRDFLVTETKELLTYLHLSDSVFDEDKIIKCALWLAGFFHDIGYFHFLFNKIEDHIKKLYPFYKGDVAGVSIAGINSLIIKRSLIWQYLTDKDKNLKENHDSWKPGVYNNLWKNHSVAGAITFIHFYQEILDHWHKVDPRMLLICELAAEAIFLHDLSKKKYFPGELKIQYDKQPLAIVLILADELQDWGRPRISYKQDGFTDTVNMKFKFDDKVPYNLDNSKKTVIFKIPEAKVVKIGKLDVFGDSAVKVFSKLKKFIQIEPL